MIYMKNVIVPEVVVGALQSPTPILTVPYHLQILVKATHLLNNRTEKTKTMKMLGMDIIQNRNTMTDSQKISMVDSHPLQLTLKKIQKLMAIPMKMKVAVTVKVTLILIHLLMTMTSKTKIQNIIPKLNLTIRTTLLQVLLQQTKIICTQQMKKMRIQMIQTGMMTIQRTVTKKMILQTL